MFFIHAMTDYMNELTKKHRAKRDRAWLIERRGFWAKYFKKDKWKLVYEVGKLAEARRLLADIEGSSWGAEFRIRRVDHVRT